MTIFGSYNPCEIVAPLPVEEGVVMLLLGVGLRDLADNPPSQAQQGLSVCVVI